MKNTLLLSLLLLINYISYSQIEEQPEKFSKINYTFKTKSNYIFNKQGIYADSTLLKHDIPNKKIVMTKSPIDSLITVGYIPYYSITEEDKYNILHNVLRFFSRTEFELNVKTKKAIIRKTIFDLTQIPAELRNALKLDIQERESAPSTISYLENFQYNVTNIIENSTESYANKKIEWIAEYENTGKIEYSTDDLTYTNLIIVDPKLNKYIIPALSTLVSNCEYGVKYIYSVAFTVELVKVKYE